MKRKKTRHSAIAALLIMRRVICRLAILAGWGRGAMSPSDRVSTWDRRRGIPEELEKIISKIVVLAKLSLFFVEKGIRVPRSCMLLSHVIAVPRPGGAIRRCIPLPLLHVLEPTHDYILFDSTWLALTSDSRRECRRSIDKTLTHTSVARGHRTDLIGHLQPWYWSKMREAICS
jgi:hypothetical protein